MVPFAPSSPLLKKLHPNVFVCLYAMSTCGPTHLPDMARRILVNLYVCPCRHVFWDDRSSVPVHTQTTPTKTSSLKCAFFVYVTLFIASLSLSLFPLFNRELRDDDCFYMLDAGFLSITITNPFRESVAD